MENRLQNILADTFARAQNLENVGELPTYIPQLANVNPELLAMSVVTVDGQRYSFGDFEHEFTIQSMSKPLLYAAAFEYLGKGLVDTAVDSEPTGDSFNSIFSLSRDGKICNPMVNAGAIAVTDLLMREFGVQTTSEVLNFLSDCAGRRLRIDQDTFRSEYETGFKNRAITCLLKTEGFIESDTEEVLKAYFSHCSFKVTVEDVALMAATFANRGQHPVSGTKVISEEYISSILSVLLSCGMYNSSGRWIYEIGVPAKSGVSGGIFMVVPGRMGIAVYSPLLDTKGNSVRATQICRELSDSLGLHMFQQNISMERQ